MEPQPLELCVFCQGTVGFRSSASDSTFLVPLPHHPTYGALAESGTTCRLCATLDSLWVFSPDHLAQPSYDLESTHLVVSSREEWLFSVSVQYSEVLPSGVCWTYCEARFRNPSTRAVIFDRFTVVSCRKSDPVSRQLSWQATATSRDDKISAIQSWLQDCRSQHTVSCEPTPCRPLRLVHVGLDGTPVRLVLGERADTGTTSGIVEYATLSHCWGDIKSSLRTTRDNLDQFSNSIPPEMLPATFADTLDIARRLAIPYVWIDALCIVQDDESEWQVEAARIDDIYLGELTIAAEDSGDSTCGCFPVKDRGGFEPGEIFFHTHTPSAVPQQGDGQGEPEPEPEPEPLLVRIYKGDMLCRPERSILSTRGWTLQETLLTNRHVSLMSPDIHWTCRRWHTTECGVSQAGFPTLQQDAGDWVVRHVPELSGEPLHKNWSAIVENYSFRQFTYASDRVAAIAGAIRYMARFSFRDNEAILGLWKTSFGNDLAWMRLSEPDESIVSQSVHKLPSWTWLASPGTAVYNFWYDLEERNLAGSHIALLDYQVTWSGTHYPSPLREIEINPFPAGARSNPPYVQVFGEDISSPSVDGPPVIWRCNAQFDHGRITEGGTYTCMLIRSLSASPGPADAGGKERFGLRATNPRFALCELFLILERVKDEEVQSMDGLPLMEEEAPSEILVYRRIGIAKPESRTGEGAFDTTSGKRVLLFWYRPSKLELVSVHPI